MEMIKRPIPIGCELTKAGKPKTSSLLGYREDNVTIPNDHRCPGRNHIPKEYFDLQTDMFTVGRRPPNRPRADRTTCTEAVATGGREIVRGSVSRKDRWSVAHGTRDERCARKGRWIKGIINPCARETGGRRGYWTGDRKEGG